MDAMEEHTQTPTHLLLQVSRLTHWLLLALTAPQEHIHHLKLSRISPTKLKMKQHTEQPFWMQDFSCGEAGLHEAWFHLNLSENQMADFVVSAREGGRKEEINEWNIRGKNRWFIFLFLDIHSILWERWGKTQFAFNLTVLSDHRSNILYAIKLSNCCLSKRSEHCLR